MTTKRGLLHDIAHRIENAWPEGHYRNVGVVAANDVGDALSALASLLRSRSLVKGPAIGAAESALAAVHGSNYRCATFSSGRVALAAILNALKIGPGDEVVVPGYTCVAVPNPIIYRGAVPIYADINKATLNQSWGTISKTISPRTRAVLVQHTFGIPVDVEPIVRECRARGIFIVEDCTHAIGATLHGRLVGTFGDAAFFSSEQTKVISTGAGGFSLTSQVHLADAIETFQESCAWPTPAATRRSLAYVARLGLFEHPNLESLHLAFHYYFDRIGWFSAPVTTDEEFRSLKPDGFERRMSNAIARVALRQIASLPRNLAHRRRIAAIYDRRLTGLGLSPTQLPKGALPAYVRYPLRVPRKKELLAFARTRNIHLGEWFSACIHPHGVDQLAAGYAEGTCPVAEHALSEVVNLPTHPRMSDRDANRVMDTLAEFCSEFHNVHPAAD